MTKTRIFFSLLVIAALFAASGIAGRQSLAPLWEPITAERLLKPRPGDWLSYRRTIDAHGFSPLSQINRENVRNLRSVWAYSVRDESRWVPTPIVANGIMYVAEGGGRVLALDAVTGELRWAHRRTYPEDIRASQAYLRQRGVAVYGDRVYW
jgi:alcohol dehydrogenase (cytochrome c)